MKNNNVARGRRGGAGGNRRGWKLAWMLAAAVLLPAALAAQVAVPGLGDTTSPPPNLPGHALIVGPHEVVNPANGSVSLSFPVRMPAGRQLTLPFSIFYSSNGQRFAAGWGGGDVIWNTQQDLLALNGWSYTVPRFNFIEYDNLEPNGDAGPFCTLYSNYVYTDPQGQPHALGLSTASPNYQPAPCNMYYSDYLVGGEGPLQAVTYNTGGANVTVTDADGTTTNFDSGPFPTSVVDRNGNVVTIATNLTSGNVTYTDTLHRAVLATSGTFGSGTTSVAVSGTDGYSMTWGAAGFSFSESATRVDPTPWWGTCNTTISASGTPHAITSLTTADGSYQFQYDSTYGLLSKITYPGGGYVRYVWAMNGQEAGTFDANPGGGWSGPGPTCVLRYATPVITDRYVSSDGVSEQEWQHFDYTTTWGSHPGQWTAKTTIVTTHDQMAGTSFATDYTYSPIFPGSAPNTRMQVTNQMPVEASVVYNDAGGHALRTETETWTGFPIVPTDQRTTLDNGLMNEVATTYNSILEPILKKEYGYGTGVPGDLMRQTATSYASFSGNNIVDRPASVILEDGTGARQAETDYAYDEVGVTATSGVTQHLGVGAAQRGNLTSASRWVAGSAFLATHYTYDDTGQQLTATDPAGNATQYSYTDSFSGGAPYTTNAYLTLLTDALGHTDHYAWNYAGGTMASHTDQNSQVTSYGYEGFWGRLTQVNYADGGETTYAYAYLPTTLDTRHKMDGSGNWTDELDTFDGLGREVTASRLNGEATPLDRVDTSYNSLGEVGFRSYPCQAATAGGAPVCTVGDSFQYDALGRLTLTTHSDGATFLTSYTGRATETQDEGNGTSRVTRITQTNGLGQLSAACEVAGTASAHGPGLTGCALDIVPTNGYLTSYAPDTLGNLKSVTQGGETRTFTYDGLSRLLSAGNPETGVTSYAYDSGGSCAAPNSFPGDLVSRTDARGVRTCYQYDALHRVVQKNYSDGTAAANFAYDQATAGGHSGLLNNVGRLSSESAGTTSEVFDHDAMGRTVHDWQNTPLAGFEYIYGYDLAGDETSSNYTRGATLTTSYNVAGRPTGVASSGAGTLISSLAYNPRGQELGATLGNGLAETLGYDARGRTTSIGAGAVYSLWGVSYAPDGDLLGSSDSANGTFALGMNELNQLAQACTPNCSGTVANYGYDRYGNRWSGGPVALNFTGSNNRVDGWSYDAAGNLLGDGTHSYAYDAENRLTSVDGGTTATYEYDAEGRRVHESVGGVVKEYVYGESGQELSVVDGSQNLLQGESYAGGRYLGTQVGSGFVYAHTDELGTIRARSNGAGSRIESDTSWPFGDQRSYGNLVSQKHFTGQMEDTETGLDYFGARYYSSQLGRFMTPDWSDSPEAVPYADLSNPQTLNLYAYAQNNPVTNIDKDGHCLICIVAAGVAIGAAIDKLADLYEQSQLAKAQAQLLHADRDEERFILAHPDSDLAQHVDLGQLDHEMNTLNLQALPTTLIHAAQDVEGLVPAGAQTSTGSKTVQEVNSNIESDANAIQGLSDGQNSKNTGQKPAKMCEEHTVCGTPGAAPGQSGQPISVPKNGAGGGQ